MEAVALAGVEVNCDVEKDVETMVGLEVELDTDKEEVPPVTALILVAVVAGAEVDGDVKEDVETVVGLEVKLDTVKEEEVTPVTALILMETVAGAEVDGDVKEDAETVENADDVDVGVTEGALLVDASVVVENMVLGDAGGKGETVGGEEVVVGVKDSRGSVKTSSAASTAEAASSTTEPTQLSNELTIPRGWSFASSELKISFCSRDFPPANTKVEINRVLTSVIALPISKPYCLYRIVEETAEVVQPMPSVPGARRCSGSIRSIASDNSVKL